MVQRHARRWPPVVAIAISLLLVGALPVSIVLAAAGTAVLTPTSDGAALSSETAADVTAPYTSSFKDLTGISISVSTAGDIGTGTLTFTTPAGYQWDASSTPSIGPGGSGVVGACGAPTASVITCTITSPNTGPGIVSFSGIRVQPVNMTPIAASAQIAIGGGATINWAAVPAGAGLLKQVPGSQHVLTVFQQPTVTATGGVAFSPNQPIAVVQDQFGNPRTGDNVILTIGSGGAAGAALTCTATSVTVDSVGKATFGNCSIDKASASPYVLRATSVSAVDFNGITVSVGAAAKIGFVQYPTNPTQTTLSPQPVVAVQDAGGNTKTGVAATIALTANAGASLTCTGGQSKAIDVGTGLAVFAGCVMSVGSGRTLTASDGTGPFADVTGAGFSVTSGAASKLAFTVQPANAAANGSITVAGGSTWTATVALQDANGNTVGTDNTTSVTLAITPNTPTSGGPGGLTCTGGNSKTVVAGVASFSCSLDKIGTAYRIRATSSPSYAQIDSNAFSVVAGAASKLTFVTQPAGATAGQPFGTQPVVAVTDAGGNILASPRADVTLSIGANPGSPAGVLTCTGGNAASTAQTGVNAGKAVFTGCKITSAGNGYTLIASASNVVPAASLATATSAAFNVTAPGAAITLTNSANVITWGGGVTLSIQFGTNGAYKTFILERTRDSFTWFTEATPTTDASGRATYVYRPATNNYYRVRFLGTADLLAGTSNTTRTVVRQIALLRPTNGGLARSIARNTSITFTTTVRPARPELPKAVVSFRFYRLSGGTWTLVTTRDVVIDSLGKAATTFKFSTAGSWYVRSIANPTPSYNANSVWSPIERYNVR